MVKNITLFIIMILSWNRAQCQSSTTILNNGIVSLVNFGDFTNTPTTDSARANRDTTALANAISYLLEAGGGTLFVPSGTYYINQTIYISNTTGNNFSGIKIIGQGPQATKIQAVGAMPLLCIKGSGAIGSGAGFLWGGSIEDLTLDGGASSQDGIDVTGWINGKIHNVWIQNFSRHGITQRVLNSANPDLSYSSVTVEDCNIKSCGGFGFYNSGFIGAPTWQFKRTLFSNCMQGGILVRSGGIIINSCSFSACGYDGSGSPYPGPAYCIQLGACADSPLSNCEIAYCEFDGGKNGAIEINNWRQADIHDNRIIFRSSADTGAHAGITFGSCGPSSIVQDISLKRNYFRYNATIPVFCYYWASTTNTTNISITDSRFADNGGPVTHYYGYNQNNVNTTNAYYISENGTVISRGSY